MGSDRFNRPGISRVTAREVSIAINILPAPGRFGSAEISPITPGFHLGRNCLQYGAL